MKKDLFREIEIPEGVEVNINGGEVIVRGPEGENKREFEIKGLKLEKKENKIKIGNGKINKKEKKIMNTTLAHIKNMIKGVQNKFEYKLKICFSHFPFNVEIKGNQAIIKNFLGEKVNRTCVLPKDAEVEVKGQDIIIKSIDKEIVGQAAANLERVTKIKKKDTRVFQDGIYITSKDGRKI